MIDWKVGYRTSHVCECERETTQNVIRESDECATAQPHTTQHNTLPVSQTLAFPDRMQQIGVRTCEDVSVALRQRTIQPSAHAQNRTKTDETYRSGWWEVVTGGGGGGGGGTRENRNHIMTKCVYSRKQNIRTHYRDERHTNPFQNTYKIRCTRRKRRNKTHQTVADGLERERSGQHTGYDSTSHE